MLPAAVGMLPTDFSDAGASARAQLFGNVAAGAVRQHAGEGEQNARAPQQ
jgi:hypothetical protein